MDVGTRSSTPRRLRDDLRTIRGDTERTATLLMTNLDGAAAQAEPGLVGGQRERPVDGDRSGFDGPRIVRGCGERARHRPAILVEVDRQRYSRSTIRPAVAVLLAEFPPARGHADPRKVQVALPTSVEPARDDPEAQRAARAGRRLGACRRLARRNRSPSPQSPTVRERAGRPLLMSPAAHGAGGRCVRQSHPRSEVVHRAGPTVRAVVTPLHRESRSPRRRSRPRVRHREPEMAVRSDDRSGGIASNWPLLLLWFTSGACSHLSLAPRHDQIRATVVVDVVHLRLGVAVVVDVARRRRGPATRRRSTWRAPAPSLTPGTRAWSRQGAATTAPGGAESCARCGR